MFIMRGGVYLYTGQRAIPDDIALDSFIALSDGRLFGIIPYAAVIAIILLGAFAYMMRHRPFGRQIYAVGGNPEVARLAGYDVRRVKFNCFLISSLLATVAGIILAARVGSAQHTAGLNFEFQVVAATVLGGVSLAGGIGSLTGMALGVLILQFLSNGLRGLGLPTEWQLVITGLIIIAAVAFDEAKRRRAAGRLKWVVWKARPPSSPAPRTASATRSPRRWRARARMSLSPTSPTRRARPLPRNCGPTASRRTMSIATCRRATTSPISSTRRSSKTGRLDVLVNNAAIAIGGMPVHEMTDDQWHRLIDVNLTSVFRGCKYALPHMIRQKSGSIINMASAQGHIGLDGWTAYAGAKGAVMAMTRQMAVEFGPMNIRVNSISPGTINTPMNDKLVEGAWRQPLQGVGEDAPDRPHRRTLGSG